MLKRYVALLVWVLSAPQLASQAPPPSAGGDPPNVVASRKDHAQEAYVVEESRTSWRFENDGTGRMRKYIRVRVQSDAGVEQWGQLQLPYNSANERMEIGYVRVLKDDGAVITALADAVQDLSSAVQRVAPVYTDTREKHVTVPGLRPGDRLEFDVTTVIDTPLAPGHFWTEHDFIPTGIVLDDELEIDVPGDRTVTLLTRPGIGHTSEMRNGRRIHRWHTDRRAAADAAGAGSPTIKKRTTREVSAVRLTTFPSWEAVGRWYGTLERTQRAPTPEIRRKAAELTAKRATAIDKLRALYEYVSTNFRYVSLSFGVGRYQPHAAADVLHNQYGDCKDKHTLLASLGESIGLHASAVLINSSLKLDPDFPSPSQFDHVITRVLIDGEEIWLDTTPEVAPFRLLAPPLRHKQALIVDGSAGSHLELSPAETPTPNRTTLAMEGTLSESGALATKVRFDSSGDFELGLRTLFRQAPETLRKTVLERMMASGGLGGEVTSWTMTDPAAIDKPFTIECQTKKANFASWTTKRLDLKLPFADFVDIGRDVMEEREGESPIEQGSARQARYTVRIELPATVTAHAPVPVSIARDYADYRSDYRVQANVFTAERSFTIRDTELPADRRNDYAAFRRVVERDVKQALGLEGTVPSTVGVATELKVDELEDAGEEALDAGRYQQAVSLFKRIIQLEPAHKTAWSSLGRAYIELQQSDLAIEALRKQIEINAYDPYAYNNLGRALVQQQKFSDGEVAFRKQLELNPLDRYAHANLGMMYLEWRKYEAAAAELETAVRLSSKDAILSIRLGEAYLNLHQHDKAMAAFDRAAALDPNPEVWNQIAYQLALNKTELELGLRYAESAVASTAGAARNLSVENVTAMGLWTVGSLAAQWDTLGWVHFAKGDTSRAEKFVRASWLLIQNTEVGDHLGQIYEKQGRRDEAARMYALALAAERPDGRTRDRLAALLEPGQSVDAVVERHRQELVQERTISVNANAPGGSAADFFVLFARGAVEAVKFISGDERLRSSADALRAVKYEAVFPDEAPAKILRRGTLSCSSPRRDCHFVMALPRDAQLAEQR